MGSARASAAPTHNGIVRAARPPHTFNVRTSPRRLTAPHHASPAIAPIPVPPHASVSRGPLGTPYIAAPRVEASGFCVFLPLHESCGEPWLRGAE